ncbi:Tetratricopeptide repeat protein [Entamoeba marina]
MVDELLCDAQDYYFSAMYSEAIQILQNALDLDNTDGGCYEMIVLCYMELRQYNDALKYALLWNSCAKRDTALRSRIALLRTSYLSNDIDTFNKISMKMLGWDENIDEVLSLAVDMCFNDIDKYINQIQNKDNENSIVNEIIRRIKQQPSLPEQDVLDEIGEAAYSIGVCVQLVIFMKTECDDDIIEQWKVLSQKNNCSYPQYALNVLNNTPIPQRGVHLILRKHGLIEKE